MKYLLMLAVLFFTVTVAPAQVPQTIKVQGFLNQNGSPANDTFTMSFTLYDAQFPGGVVVASVAPQSVSVTNGLYEVDLPLASSAFTGSSRYLEIAVNGEVLTPRMQMASAPFAYQADRLNGFEAADFVNTAGGTITGSLQVAGTISSTTGGFTFPDGTVQATAATGFTLNQAYNQGGPGAGRTIDANSGAVNVAGPGGLTVAAGLQVGGIVSSTNGGFMFPDGTTQTSAAVAAGNPVVFDSGDIALPGSSSGTFGPLDLKGYDKVSIELYNQSSPGAVDIFSLRWRNSNLTPFTAGWEDCTRIGVGDDGAMKTLWRCLSSFEASNFFQPVGPGSSTVAVYNVVANQLQISYATLGIGGVYHFRIIVAAR